MRENLEEFIKKLVHPLTEIRIRSANTLQQKLEVGVCEISDLLQNTAFLLNVTSLLQSDFTVLKMHGINLLHFILQDPQGAMNFEFSGGKQTLHELRSSLPTYLEKSVDLLLQKLNTRNVSQAEKVDLKLSKESYGSIGEENFFSSKSLASIVHPDTFYEDSVKINSSADSDNDSCITERDLLYNVSSPILFTVFPWVPLTNIDLQVLDSTGQALMDASDTDVMVTLQVCQSTLFKDFPIEIFLQRPFILKVLLGHLVAEVNQESDGWRLQERVCTTLCAFSSHLFSRLMDHNEKLVIYDTEGASNSYSSASAGDSNEIQPPKCCSYSSSQKVSGRPCSNPVTEIPSVETLHESEDSNEFMLLKVHQLTVVDWCCQLLSPAFEFLKKSQPRLSSALLRLTSLTMRVLRVCMHPPTLWHLMANNPQEADERGLLHKISSSLLQSLRVLSTTLLQAYEESKLPLCSSDLEATWNKIRNITRVYIYWINLFSPSSEFDMVFGHVEVEAFQYLLSDACFYLEWPEDYAVILSISRYMEEEIATQANALIEAKRRLEDTKSLLQISSPEVDEFLERASSSLPLLFLHQSRVLVEKVVRGLAKQAASVMVSPLQVSRGRSLLLQLLSDPNDESRILGYNALRSVVVESVGISQASQTTRSRSLKMILVLHPRVVNHLIYSGCVDANHQVVEASRMTLLSLIRGHHLMTEEVLRTATSCFSDCLLNLQNLVEAESYLGRAVLNLPYELSRRRDDQDMHLLRVKFFLKCLQSRDLKVRQECLSNCLALLVTSSSEYVPVATSEIEVRRDANLFILNSPVEALPSCPTDTLDRGALEKVLSVISTSSVDPSITRAAWIQLTFLLRNPAQHSGLEARWPLSDLISTFASAMKVSGERGFTVVLVPSILEALRLRASFSASARSSLATDVQILLLVLRAALFFRTNDSVRVEASLFFALVLNEEVLVQKKSLNSGYCPRSFSVPSLVSSSQHIAFTHSEHPWPTEAPSNPRMRTLRTMATHDDGISAMGALLPVSPLRFLRLVWVVVCAEDWKDLLSEDVDFVTAFSSRLVLSQDEVAALRTRLVLPNAAGLLIGAQNATSHRAVKCSANKLQSLLVSIDDDEEKVSQVLRLEGWTEAFARFFLTCPTTASDKQVLFHVMSLVSDALALVDRRSEADCMFCPLIYLLVVELSKSESALSVSLKETGTEHPTSSTQEALQSTQLLDSLLGVVSLLFHLSAQWVCKCRSSSPSWQNLAANVTPIFTLILKECKTRQNYNLNVLVPTLECLIHVVENQPIREFSVQLTPILIDLLMCFHTGRGRAHNVFLGRAVSIRALLVMAFVVEDHNLEVFEQVMSILREEVPSLSWLLSALEHSDPALMTAGLKVAIALSMTSVGARLLDESFHRIPGGIWTLAFRYFVKPGVGVLVRVSCAQLLLNLSSHVVGLPEEEKPWLSLSLSDTVTGVTVIKEDALMEVLKLFGVFRNVKQMLETIRPLTTKQTEHFPDIEMKGQLKEFVSSEESEWATLEQLEDDADALGVDSIEDFPELVASSLFLFVNLMQLDSNRMRESLSSHGVGKTLLRRFGMLAEDVKVSDKWNEVLEGGFTLLETMGKTFSANTHLASLALNILSSQHTLGRPYLRQSCFHFLSLALSEGGWGSVRVLELLRENRLPVMSALVQVLHEGNPTPYMTSGVTFVGALCKAADGATSQAYITSLRDLLDSPLEMYTEKIICPGWEISRHLIQLLPSNIDTTLSRSYSFKPSEQEGKLKSLLEALKLLFLMSSSARQCAYFQLSPLLKLLSFALSNLNAAILSVNIHITSNLMNKKELTADFLFATHCLQVATNWIADAPEISSGGREGEDGSLFCPSAIGESLIPELHPLWVSALRAAPFAESLIQFLISASSHAEVCPFLTRTSVLPGALLSNSRTRNSLLVSMTTSVTRLLERRKTQGGRCENGCATLPRALLEDSLDLLINCGRVRLTAYVIVKEGFLKTVVKFLEHFRDLNTLVVQKLLQCLTILTLHKEARTALIKIPLWIKCLKVCLKENSLRKNVLLVFMNMIANLQVVKNMLSTEDFLPPMVAILTEASQDLTRGAERPLDAEVHICVVVLWCLAANNQRCKAILRRLNLLPHLENLFQHHRHPQFCVRLIEIINS